MYVRTCSPIVYAYILITELILLNTNQTKKAFGDGENDVEMFQVVNYGIAVANAKPMLKDAARFVTEANSENGVGKALDTIVQAVIESQQC